jgi:hypothetical protein
MASDRYKQLSINNVKNKNNNKGINFSFPFKTVKLMGEVFMGILCDEIAKFLSDSFDIDIKKLNVTKVNKKTSKFEACLVRIKSSSDSFIINNSSIVASCILNELIEKNPGIIYKSNSHRNNKTKTIDDDKVIDMVDMSILKSIIENIFIQMIRHNAPAIEIIEIPAKEHIYKRYGHLEIMEHLTYIFKYSRHVFFNYNINIYENLNIDGDSEIAKSNLEFINKLFSEFSIYNYLAIISKTMNKIIVIYNTKENGEMFDKIFTMCTCTICGESNVILHNMIPIKLDNMCIICAKQAQSAREIVFESLNQVSCFSGDCGENPTLYYLFRQGVYIRNRENHPFNILDVSMWKYRGYMFMQYLNDVVLPKFNELVEIKPQALPDAETVNIMYDAIVDRLDFISSNITECIDEVSSKAVLADDFLTPLQNLLVNVRQFKEELSTNKSPQNVLDKSKTTGELIRLFGYIYYPMIVEVNSHYQFDQFVEKVLEKMPIGINVTDNIKINIEMVIKALEEVRCYSFCDFCKNFMMKIDACDTGTCTNCSHIFCMEHGTTLSKDQVYCNFVHSNGGKCNAFYHVTQAGFRWDNVPATLESTCVCKLCIC